MIVACDWDTHFWWWGWLGMHARGSWTEEHSDCGTVLICSTITPQRFLKCLVVVENDVLCSRSILVMREAIWLCSPVRLDFWQ